MAAPKCKTCGRSLRVHERSRNFGHWSRTHRGPRSEAEVRESIPPGSKITKRETWDDGAAGILRWIDPNPEYGARGCGNFCGVLCGYRFAEAVLRRVAERSGEHHGS